MKVLMAYARALVRARVLPRLAGWRARGDARNTDADPRGINRVLDQISAAWFKKFPAKALQASSENIAPLTSEHQKGQLFKQVKASVGVDLKGMTDKGLGERIKRFTAENVALIETLPQRYFDDIERSVLEGVRAGARASDIAEDMQERFSVSESRAKIIARDQVLKFNGELNGARQKALGIEGYIWRTVKDERVRDTHQELDGELFSWDAPPEPGHPGEDYNCRCYAEPVLPVFEE